MVNIDAPEPPSPLAPLTPVGGVAIAASVSTPVSVTPPAARGLATLEQHTKVWFGLTIRCFDDLVLTYSDKCLTSACLFGLFIWVRAQDFHSIMAAERINMDALQQWAFRGIPEKLPRALVWKVSNI